MALTPSRCATACAAEPLVGLLPLTRPFTTSAQAPPLTMPEVDVLKISNEDAAFVLGKNGKTKEKIARVSGADLDLFEHSLTLEIRGSDDERKRAKKCAPASSERPAGRLPSSRAARTELTATPVPRACRYVECVMAQRVGPVTIDDNNEDDDLTVIMVPSEAVGFVTGSGGNFLRQVEEEWGTLMFFADFRGRGERHEVNRPSASDCHECDHHERNRHERERDRGLHDPRRVARHAKRGHMTPRRS